MKNEKVKTLMNPHPHLVGTDDTLRQAARLMQEFDCGSLVVGENDKPEGLITDRDIVVWGLAEGRDPDQTRTGDIMTSGVITCSEDDTIEHAADKMSDSDVRRLVVLDRDEKIVGVISMVDILKCSDQDVLNDEVLHHLFKYA